MQSDLLIKRLEKNANVYHFIAKNTEMKQLSWKPQPDQWSVLEVFCHLFDEEREDFRSRIDCTLSSPQKEWLPIDPLNWVKTRKYNQQNFNEITEKFVQERNKSVNWLNNLKSVDWTIIYNHPKTGKISAGDLLASWVTHDFLHIRQLASLNIEYLKNVTKPFDVKYAMD